MRRYSLHSIPFLNFLLKDWQMIFYRFFKAGQKATNCKKRKTLSSQRIESDAANEATHMVSKEWSGHVLYRPGIVSITND